MLNFIQTTHLSLFFLIKKKATAIIVAEFIQPNEILNEIFPKNKFKVGLILMKDTLIIGSMKFKITGGVA